jgi:hypothetical protein
VHHGPLYRLNNCSSFVVDHRLHPEAALLHQKTRSGFARQTSSAFAVQKSRMSIGLQSANAKAESQSQRRLRKGIRQATGATHFDEVTGPELTSGTDINVNTRHCLLCHADELAQLAQNRGSALGKSIT